MTERAKKLLLLYYKQSRKIRRVSGLPPLTFKAKKAGTLKNYRIYGQTVDGESVGDRTGNLFDGAVEQGSFRGGTGDEVDTLTRVRTTFFSLLSAGTYTINATGIDAIVAYMYTDQYKFDIASSCVTWQPPPLTFSLSKDRFVRFAFKYNDDSNISITDISQIMLNFGSTPLPYEPYGYKVPVTVSDGTDTLTTPIYLPEPIKMVGDEAEYIDYAEQKMHRVGADDIDVTLPELPVLPGTNTLTVGTEVQLSGVEIKGRIKAAGGD